jgi:ArsR family transcriptional regulator
MDDRRSLLRTPARLRVDRPSPPSRDVSLARMAKALGHPARVTILRMLIASGECHCQVIVDRLPLAQATVSQQHLKILKQAGLIRGDIDPPRVCYCVNPEAVKRLKSLIGEL